MTDDPVRQLADIIKQLQAVLLKLEGRKLPEPVVPSEAAAKAEKGICLRCGKKKSEVKGSFRRGNCPSCRRYVKDKIDKSSDSSLIELELINLGLTLPEGYSTEADPVSELIKEVEEKLGKKSKTRRKK